MRRRWTQVSLRSLLLLTLCCAIALGLWAAYIQPYHQEQRLVFELSRGEQFAATTEAVGSECFKRVVGSTYAQRVKEVDMGSGFTDHDLAKLRQFSHLKAVSILDGAQITDEGLAHLANLVTLEELTLGSPAITEQGLSVLSRLPNLRDLSIIRGPSITDQGLAYIGELRELRELMIVGEVSDEGMQHLTPLTKLESLQCYSPNMSQPWITLSDPTQVNFVETSLSDVIEYLADFHKLRIRLDLPELAAHDYDLTKLTVTLNQQGSELNDCLPLILSPHGLDFVIESDGLLITTKEAAGRRRQGIEELRRKLPNLKQVDVWWAPRGR